MMFFTNSDCQAVFDPEAQTRRGKPDLLELCPLAKERWVTMPLSGSVRLESLTYRALPACEKPPGHDVVRRFRQAGKPDLRGLATMNRAWIICGLDLPIDFGGCHG